MSKKTFQSKLKAYSAMAGSVLATVGTAEAQIIHTDIDPDHDVDSVTTSPFYIDLDNNGTTDFAFQGYTDTAYGAVLNVGYLLLSNQSDNAAMCDLYSPAGYSISVPIPTGLAAGTLIDATATTWVDSTSYGGHSQYIGLVGGPTSFNIGTIHGQGDKFIGLRFNDTNNNTYYGWVRLSATPTLGVMTIKDFAYNAVPNGPINAGDLTNSTVQVLAPDAWSVIAQDKSILVNTDLEDAQISIYNTAGQLIETSSAKQGLNTINLSGQAAGVYLVNINSGKIRGTKKVVLN